MTGTPPTCLDELAVTSDVYGEADGMARRAGVGQPPSWEEASHQDRRSANQTLQRPAASTAQSHPPMTAEEAAEGPVVYGQKVYGPVPLNRAVQLLRRHAVDLPAAGPGRYISTRRHGCDVDVDVDDLVCDMFQPDTVVYWCGEHSGVDMAIVRGGKARAGIRLRHPGPPPDYGDGYMPPMPSPPRWDVSAQSVWGNEDRPDGTPWVRTDWPEPDGLDRLAATGADVSGMYDVTLDRFLRDRGVDPEPGYPPGLPVEDRGWYAQLTMQLLALPFCDDPAWRERWRP